MLKHGFTVTAIALALLATSIVFAQQGPSTGFQSYGFGTFSCENWLTARGGPDGLQKTSNTAWVLGFVSGAGWAGPGPLKTADVDTIESWMDNYCRDHRLDAITIASEALVLELEIKP